jgi:poly(hydroxyalkanoate) granule-associated protein
MAEATLRATDRIAMSASEATATMTHALRRVWLACLGAVVVAGEQAQSALEALEQKGQQLEPTVTRPFKRAGDAANRVVERAGGSVRNFGTVVNTAGETAVSLGRRFGLGDQVGRLVDEKLPAALERLDVPTRKDVQELTERVEQLAAKLSRARKSDPD